MDKKILELSSKIKEFDSRFKDPLYIAIDLYELENFVFDCMETEDAVLIYKAAQTMVNCSENVMISEKFSVKQTERIVALLNIIAAYCARKNNKFTS